MHHAGVTLTCRRLVQPVHALRGDWLRGQHGDGVRLEDGQRRGGGAPLSLAGTQVCAWIGEEMNSCGWMWG